MPFKEPAIAWRPALLASTFQAVFPVMNPALARIFEAAVRGETRCRAGTDHDPDLRFTYFKPVETARTAPSR